MRKQKATFERDQKIERILHALERELGKIFKDKLKKIILFGSYSRGDYDDESDIDVMVLVDDSNPYKYDDALLDVEVDLSLEFEVVLSIFAENESAYEEAKTYKPFLKAIEKEGIEIYAA